jgi:hypothetical protein
VTTACADEATALAFQVNRVNSAFTGFHTDLEKLRALRDASTIETADRLLQAIRQGAVKAIHATATAACVKQDDDEDENDDENDNDDDKSLDTAAPVASVLSVVGDSNNDESNDGRGDHKVAVTFTGTASAIADQAVAAMQVAFDAAKNAPARTPRPTPTHKVESTKGPLATATRSPAHTDDKKGHD